jgi:hypothetical protein
MIAPAVTSAEEQSPATEGQAKTTRTPAQLQSCSEEVEEQDVDDSRSTLN